MEIRLLYFEGCPNVDATFALLKDCLDRENVAEPILLMKILNAVEAARYGFLGSPSIQINGEDIETSRCGGKPFFGCRIYDPSSATPGEPSRELILGAIRRARTRL